MVKVEIDKYSGFCFGVRKAIEAATFLLEQGGQVYCVGDIVHNEAESSRLNKLGMSIIKDNDLSTIEKGTVLFRAHGEPPASYNKIKDKGLALKDATCPVVLKLQQRIKAAYLKQKALNGQIVIYGKRGHAEVIGLIGQTNGEAIVIEDVTELEHLDFSRPIEVFAQTTKNPDTLKQLITAIEKRVGYSIAWHNTTCKQVTGRVPRIMAFAKKHPVIVFVGGKKSSNAKVLFNACKKTNNKSYFVSSSDEIDDKWFKGIESIGVCGATSTPDWLLEEVATSIRNLH